MAEGGDDDQEQKTEEPTQKKLQEAIDKGNVANSKELASFLMLLFLAYLVISYSPKLLHESRALMIAFIASPETMAVDFKGVSIILREIAIGSVAILMIPLLGSIIVALASGVLQHGIMFSAESIKPKLDKISPLAGIKRLFSAKTVVEFVKNLLKISIVAIVAYMAVVPNLGHLKQLPNDSAEAILLFILLLSGKLLVGILIALFFITLFDIVYQRFQHIKSLRMTKQEVKDEYKQTEGDPVIKQKLRQLRQEKAKQRMMADVPKSDVVITNPTHFAVALQYDSTKMKAPKIVAKGQDLVALRIKTLAEENKVPVVQNPPLARALFSNCEVDEEVPLEHYEAVAKIISYVYQLKGKKI